MESTTPSYANPDDATAGMANIFERTICVHIAVHTLGNTKQVPDHEIHEPSKDEGGANKARLRMTKMLIDAPEFGEMAQKLRELRIILRRKALSAKMLSSGHYLIPLVNVEEVDQAIQDFVQERKEIANRLSVNYADYVEKSREELGSEKFKSEEYHHPEEVPDFFSVEYRYVNIGSDPSRLQSISDKLFRRELDRAKTEIKNFTEDTQQFLRGQALNFTKNILKALDSEPGEPAKGFRRANIDNIKMFAQDFLSGLDVTDDSELRNEVYRLLDVANGVEPEQLRESGLVKKLVQADFEKIEESLSKLIVEKPNGRHYRSDV